MKRFKNVVCIIEPNKPYESALQRAIDMSENNQAKLTLVTVIEKPNSWPVLSDNKNEATEFLNVLVENKKAELDEIIALRDSDIDIAVDVLVGTPFIEIIRDVLRHHRDIVIKCPEQEDWIDHLFGSNDMHLLRKCPCPVMIVKTDAAKTFDNILATVDVDDFNLGSEAVIQRALNKQVLELASASAIAEFSELHVGSVWDAYGEGFLRHGAFSNMPDEKVDKYVEQSMLQFKSNLDTLMREMGEFIGEEAMSYLDPHVHLVKGQARKEIPAMVKQYHIDLIVMGTVARTGIPGFIIGNTAEAVLNQIDCSVLAMKPQGFQTPVTLEC